MLHAYTYTHIHDVCVCICVCIHVYVCTYVWMDGCICMYVCMHACMHLCMYAGMYTYDYMHACIHVYIRTYKHTHIITAHAAKRRKPRTSEATRREGAQRLKRRNDSKNVLFQATPDVDVSTSTFRVASTQHATRTTYIMCWYSHSHDV